MYYGYNDNKQLLMVDEAFMELLGYATFDEVIEADVLNKIKVEKKKVLIEQKGQTITSDFIHHEVYGTEGSFYLVELKNITIEKTFKEEKSSFPTNYQSIYLDVDKISDEIGLSVEDYKLYLDSFIDQSIIDEKRLLEGNDRVIKNLSNLALTLKIPHINILLLKIQKLSHRERMPLIDQYYTKLALLTLERPEDYIEENENDLLETDTQEQENKEEILNARFTDLLKNVSEDKNNKPINEFDVTLLDETNTIETPLTIKNVPLENKAKINSGVKEIILDNISALAISYDPQTAADELNLPVVLIEEFVDDFIEQARQDIDHLLTSYYQKDMDNIHELGHKLKGAASNLRINDLADILEEIQYCTEHSKLEALLIKYWGHFLSLEDYMKQLNRV